MSAIGSVFFKEVTDNLRDRRTLMSSLLFGPLFGPILFAVMMSFMINQTVREADEPLELPVVGQAFAPNLIDFLEQNGATIMDAPDDPQAAVKLGDHDVVLVIPPNFAERFRAAEPARVQLVTDNSNTQTLKSVGHARRLLDAYSARTGLLRLQARGINPLVTQALMVEELDTSTPSGRAVLVLGMMTYLIIFAVLIGGMYLAIDTTAGERERGSLEPLLTLPVPRGSLIIGKIAATCAFMMLSLLLTLSAFVVSLKFVPLETLGMTASFGVAAALQVFLIMLPFVLLGAALMTVVASFTRSYKEAQTWLSAVLFVPTLPIVFAAVNSLRPSIELMAVPSLAQHLLITDLIKNEPIQLPYVLVASLCTMALGVLLTVLAVRLYRREAILG